MSKMKTTMTRTTMIRTLCLILLPAALIPCLSGCNLVGVPGPVCEALIVHVLYPRR